MSCNGDGLFPAFHTRFNPLYHNGGAEHGAVQDGTDGGVWTFPHFLQMIFLHTGSIGGDGGALDSHTVLLGGVGGINGYLVIGFIPVFQAQVVVLCLQVYVWQKQVVLNHLPENPCHLIAIHLHDGGGHLNFVHTVSS